MEYHLKYSDSKESGTYHEGVSLYDWYWVFYCPRCGIERRSERFWPVQEEYPMQDRQVLATHPRCDWQWEWGPVIFDEMLESMIEAFPKYHSNYHETPTMEQVIQTNNNHRKEIDKMIQRMKEEGKY